MSSPVRVYRPIGSDGFEWALPVDSADFETLHTLELSSPLSVLGASEMELLKIDDRSRRERRRAMMPWLGSSLIVLRDEAIDIVGPLLGAYGTVFPVRCREARLAVFGAPLLEGALDEEASEPVRFSDGGIMYMPQPIFHSDVVSGAGAFKLAEMPRGDLHLTGELVDAILATGQTSGTDFILLFEDGTEK